MPRSTCSTRADVPFWQRAAAARRAIAWLPRGPRVARYERMRKLLISVAVSSFLRCAPALADTPQPPGDAPAASVKVSLVVKQGADARTHELVISERGCGAVKEKAASYEDDIRVCS